MSRTSATGTATPKSPSRRCGAARLEQQVGGLHVAVHDARGVHRASAWSSWSSRTATYDAGQRPVLGEQVVDRAAADQVHREHDAVVLGGPAGRRDDVRVRDPDRLLADEAQQHAAVVGAEHLGRDDLAGAQVAGPPHRAHRARADLVEQDVAAGERRGRRTVGHRACSYPLRDEFMGAAGRC